MKGNDDKLLDTRQRLLQAAGEVFARRGFKSATVREISLRAKANIAAINYHFGDKEGLYSAVLEHSLGSALKKYPPDLNVTTKSRAEERLDAFIRSFLSRLLDDGRPAWHGKLVALEIANPTAALDQIIETVIGPLYAHLTVIVRELMADSADEESIHACVFSIMGQCLFFHHSRHVITKLYPQELGAGAIGRLTNHITKFSMGAIKGLAGQAEKMTRGISDNPTSL
ncbi:MAG: CerR family C-terminal domain-containing protein [Deltaproteobacteria bacterium]|nr:CerR family C-terminal domain-containing protein [Deltaproteobacteria bacterium]